MLQVAAFGAFEQLGILQIAIFVVVEMQRIPSMTAFGAFEKPGKLHVATFAALKGYAYLRGKAMNAVP